MDEQPTGVFLVACWGFHKIDIQWGFRKYSSPLNVVNLQPQQAEHKPASSNFASSVIKQRMQVEPNKIELEVRRWGFILFVNWVRNRYFSQFSIHLRAHGFTEIVRSPT